MSDAATILDTGNEGGNAAEVDEANAIAAVAADANAGGEGADGADGASAAGEDGASGASDEWRETYSGGDEDVLKELERYTAPTEVAKALVESKRKNRERIGAAIPDADASDEQIRAFNEQHRIPERPAGYEFDYKPPEHLVDEHDSAFLTSVTEDLHAKGGVFAMPGVMEEVNRKFYEIKETQLKQFDEGGQAKDAEALGELKKEWGADYGTNVKLANAALQEFGDIADAKDILEQRMADGSTLGSQTWLVKMMASVARRTGEDVVFARAGNASDPRSLDDQISAERDLTDKDPAAWAKSSAPGGRYYDLMKLKASRSNRAA